MSRAHVTFRCFDARRSHQPSSHQNAFWLAPAHLLPCICLCFVVVFIQRSARLKERGSGKEKQDALFFARIFYNKYFSKNRICVGYFSIALLYPIWEHQCFSFYFEYHIPFLECIRALIVLFYGNIAQCTSTKNAVSHIEICLIAIFIVQSVAAASELVHSDLKIAVARDLFLSVVKFWYLWKGNATFPPCCIWLWFDGDCLLQLQLFAIQRSIQPVIDAKIQMILQTGKNRKNEICVFFFCVFQMRRWWWWWWQFELYINISHSVVSHSHCLISHFEWITWMNCARWLLK